VQHIFRGISRALGTSVTPHALRHTYATLLRQAGVPDRIAMDLLGHSSLQMLQRYSHVYNCEREAAAGRLVLDIDVPAA
jgi:integrase/recombinase XerC